MKEKVFRKILKRYIGSKLKEYPYGFFLGDWSTMLYILRVKE